MTPYELIVSSIAEKFADKHVNLKSMPNETFSAQCVHLYLSLVADAAMEYAAGKCADIVRNYCGFGPAATEAVSAIELLFGPSSVPKCAQNGAGEGNRTPDQQLGKG